MEEGKSLGEIHNPINTLQADIFSYGRKINQFMKHQSKSFRVSIFQVVKAATAAWLAAVKAV